MARRIWAWLRSALFWSYRRGSWQYDVIVALILAFVFLTPRSLFNDRPSEAVVHEVKRGDDGSRVFWIEPGALEQTDQAGADRQSRELVRSFGGETLQVVRTESALDAAGNVRAYIVYAR